MLLACKWEPVTPDKEWGAGRRGGGGWSRGSSRGAGRQSGAMGRMAAVDSGGGGGYYYSGAGPVARPEAAQDCQPGNQHRSSGSGGGGAWVAGDSRENQEDHHKALPPQLSTSGA